MNSQDVKTVTLVINSDQAKKKLEEINLKLEAARRKRQEAFDKGDAKGLQVYTREVKNLESQAARLQARAQTVTKTLTSLDKATPNELRKTIKEINKELNSGSIERGSEEWKALTSAIAQAKNELAKIREEQTAAARLSDSASAFGQRWVGLSTVITQARDTISSAFSAMKDYVSDYADMQEHMANVTKYTGLAADQVDELNESFQKMETRTPREKLNDLAADAGRLGIQTKEGVQEFVEAADIINTALGEDLGEDAVKNIGKLAQMFGESDRLGLRGAMLATGSVINELAQSSSAAEGYIMEFANRLAGVGNQAGLSQAQIMAFGSVLDQNAVNVEKGATALQNVFTALFKNPAKMAQAAGLEVQKFTELLSTDANAALLQWLQALKDTGGMDKLNAKAHSDNAKTVDALTEACKRAAQDTAEEKTKIDLLNKAVHSTSLRYEERLSALNQLKAVIPSYYAFLTKEGTLERDNISAIDDYITALHRKAEAEAVYDKLVELKKKGLELSDKRDRKQNNVNRVQNVLDNGGLRYMSVKAPDDAPMNAGQELNKSRIEKQKELAVQTSALASAQKDLDDNLREQAKLEQHLQKMGATGISAISRNSPAVVSTPRAASAVKISSAEGSASSSGINKVREAALDKAAATERAKRLVEYAQGKTDYMEFRNALQKIDTDTLTSKRNLYAEDSTEWKRHNEELVVLAESQGKQRNDWSIADLNRQEKDELAAARERHARGLASDEEYEEQKHVIAVQYLERRKNLYAQYGDVENYEKTDTTLQETLQNGRLAKLEKFEQQAAELKKKYQQQSAEERRASEFQMLEAVYNATDENCERVNLLSQEEYEDLKKQIEAATGASEKFKSTLGSPTDSLSSGII